MNQHVARLEERQAAGAQIEDRILVELADRRPVRALHVVGEDLQLRLGVDQRVVREQQRAVGLFRVGLLRVLAHDDLAVEHRPGTPAENALVDFVARAVGAGVIDGRVVVDQAVAVGEIQPVQRHLGAFAVERRQHVVANQLAAERERVRREVGAAGGVHVHAADMERAVALLLHLVVIQHGALADEHLGDGIGEVLHVARADVGLDDPCLAALAENNQRARVAHRPDRPAADTNRICSGSSSTTPSGT